MHEVEIELISVVLGQEVAVAGEVFQVEESVFFGEVHGFDVALLGVRGGGIGCDKALPKDRFR
jgi:hypothetical protein